MPLWGKVSEEERLSAISSTAKVIGQVGHWIYKRVTSWLYTCSKLWSIQNFLIGDVYDWQIMSDYSEGQMNHRAANYSNHCWRISMTSKYVLP